MYSSWFSCRTAECTYQQPWDGCQLPVNCWHRLHLRAEAKNQAHHRSVAIRHSTARDYAYCTVWQLLRLIMTLCNRYQYIIIYVILLGWIQVQLLAGALQRPIYQVMEDDHHSLYNLPVYPCACCEDPPMDPVWIMWVRCQVPTEESRQVLPISRIMWVHFQVSTEGQLSPINHIIPLIPGSG